MMRKFFQVFLLIDAGVILFFALQQDISGLLNSQVAAASALAVAFGSFMGYRNTINDQVERFEGTVPQERDMLDKIDDTYELFDDDAVNDSDLTDEEAKMIFLEEKAKVKQRASVKNVFLTYRGIFSPFRLFAYGFLIFGFFWLEGNGNLEILPYLAGLSILPATTIVSSFFNR